MTDEKHIINKFANNLRKHLIVLSSDEKQCDFFQEQLNKLKIDQIILFSNTKLIAQQIFLLAVSRQALEERCIFNRKNQTLETDKVYKPLLHFYEEVYNFTSSAHSEQSSYFLIPILFSEGKDLSIFYKILLNIKKLEIDSNSECYKVDLTIEDLNGWLEKNINNIPNYFTSWPYPVRLILPSELKQFFPKINANHVNSIANLYQDGFLNSGFGFPTSPRVKPTRSPSSSSPPTPKSSSSKKQIQEEDLFDLSGYDQEIRSLN